MTIADKLLPFPYELDDDMDDEPDEDDDVDEDDDFNGDDPEDDEDEDDDEDVETWQVTGIAQSRSSTVYP